MQYPDLPTFIARHVTGRAESLLAADLRAHESELRRQIEGASVLVIGGAGTIGASFIRALLPCRPRRLYVVDTNENGLTELTRGLRSAHGLYVPDDYKPYPIGFGSPVFAKILAREGPFDIVANFAAHKHVRSEKDHYSIEAMIRNNAILAKGLLAQLAASPPKRFFCVSTDKAANPVNVMGASKKLMEEVILAYAQQMPISTARFANVAFSNGSLPDGFLHRLMQRQPLSSPLDVRRYFVSPAEAGELCLLACILGRAGDIFFPKLEAEEMKSFSDIATALLREMGYEPDLCASEEEARAKAARLGPASKSWPVYFFPSDTSGEKLYEEFYTAGEDIDWGRFRALGVIRGRPACSLPEIEARFAELERLFDSPGLDKGAVVELLERAVPGFRHIEKGKGLDERM